MLRTFSLANLADIYLPALAAVFAVGAGCVAYGVFVERHWYRLTRYRLGVLPEEAQPLTILHLSDLHFDRADTRLSAFIAELPTADVTVLTGDILGEPSALDAVVEALRPASGRLASYFVLGSNDYYAPGPRNYMAYFYKRRRRRLGTRSRGEELVHRLQGEGWEYLPNRKAALSVDGVRVEVVGLDDPHIERHDLRVAPRNDEGAVGLAVTHSPDLAPELAALGYDVILAGHTHGGQVRLPFVGALVTNGTTPTRLCMGLSLVGGSYLHVSPGMGTSKYAPFRFLCRPEATLLELVPAAQGERRVRGRAAYAPDAASS
jgi:uncharacterized protein